MAEITQDWRTSFPIEYNTDTVFPRVLKMGYRALRTARWKLIRYKEFDGMDELYDLVADPYELNNLIADPAAAAALRELSAELEHLFATKS